MGCPDKDPWMQMRRKRPAQGESRRVDYALPRSRAVTQVRTMEFASWVQTKDRARARQCGGVVLTTWQARTGRPGPADGVTCRSGRAGIARHVQESDNPRGAAEQLTIAHDPADRPRRTASDARVGEGDPSTEELKQLRMQAGNHRFSQWEDHPVDMAEQGIGKGRYSG